MSEAKDQTIALNVRLKPRESSAHPRATNYTNVGVAQGIAYLDFGSSSRPYSPPLPRRQKMTKRRLKRWTAPSLLGWPWGPMSWRGCINRFSKF